MKRHPEGLRTLFFTELWERFSYYGMRALLVLFMVDATNSGGLGLSTDAAALVYGNYTMAVYMLAIPGGLIADRYIGPSHAVLIGGLIIALGHFTLAYPSLLTFYLGLTFIALGTGLFKPSISVLLGKLYHHKNDLRDAGFSMFYMGINIGAFFAPLITGFLAQSTQFKIFLEKIGFNPSFSWHFGFAAAGFGMLFGLRIYLRSLSKFKNLYTKSADNDEQQFSLTTTHAGFLLFLTALLALLFLLSDYEKYTELRYLVFMFPLIGLIWSIRMGTAIAFRIAAALVFLLCSVLFWGIFEQAGLSIALFAEKLTRSELFGIAFPSSWFQSLNALFVIILSPLFATLWMRMGDHQPSTPVKFGLGLIFLSLSFFLMVPAAILTSEGRVSPLWLVGLFLLQTIGELFLSPVGLSTMTKLAPEKSAGVLLGVWFLGSAFGNKLAGILGSFFQTSNPMGLSSAFLYQSLCVAIAGVVMLLFSATLKRWMGEIT